MAPLIALIADPRHGLTEEGNYRLSEEQARAILDLRLQRLTALGRAASQVYERHCRSPFTTRARDFTRHHVRTQSCQATLRVIPRLRAGQASKG